MDLIGLGLVAVGVFLAFPLYLEWYGGAAGEAIVDGLRRLAGQIAYVSPIAVAGAGVVLVLRPVLPAGVRPFRAGAICLLLALTLMLAAGTLGLGPSTSNVDSWNPTVYSDRGGIVGAALFWATSSAFSTIGAHIIALFLFLAGTLLLTGASVAGVVQATASGVADTTRALRPTSSPDESGAPATSKDATAGGAPRTRARPAARDEESVAPVLPPEPQDSEPLVRDDRSGQLDGSLRYPDIWGDADAAVIIEPTVVDRRDEGPLDDPQPVVENVSRGRA